MIIILPKLFKKYLLKKNYLDNFIHEANVQIPKTDFSFFGNHHFCSSSSSFYIDKLRNYFIFKNPGKFI